MQRIKRKRSSDNFTILNNEFLRDESLSLKAKGLLAYILSLPDDWKIYFEEIEKHHKDGKSSLRAAWKELEENGYARKIRKVDPVRNTVIEWYKEVSDYKKPDTDFPDVAFPDVAFPDLENRKLLNTNKQSTNKPNTELPNNIADESADSDLDKRFELLWKLYPRKAGSKAKAKTAYKKAVKKGVADSTIKEAIISLINEKREFQYIPHGQTWFCNERWTDELNTPKSNLERVNYSDLDLPF